MILETEKMRILEIVGILADLAILYTVNPTAKDQRLFVVVPVIQFGAECYSVLVFQ
jgi:hypothetical protein